MKEAGSAIKVGVLVLAALFGSYATYKGLGKDSVGAGSVPYTARLKDASGIPIGSKVMVAGLPVGEIVDRSVEGRYARVKFRVRRNVDVYDSAVIYKKMTSLLGEYYLELDPGGKATVDAAGVTQQHGKLARGGEIVNVVETTSVDQLLRRIEEVAPNIDSVLLSVKDLSEDVRRIVNGPVASIAGRVDALVQKESGTVSDILAKADRSMERIDLITQDLRKITGGADARITAILDNLEVASSEAKLLMTSAKSEVELTGGALREKLDMLDGVITSTDSIAKKIDEDKGTLGRLVNDPTIADNVEDITTDAKGFLGTLFGLQTYVGLRTEYNVFAGITRNYIQMELQTRPDKFYLIELESGPRGGYPQVTLTLDPTVDPNNWVRRTEIEDRARFTFQFGKRLGPWSLRFGVKESTGGVGVDYATRWWGRSLRLSGDVFDSSWDKFPRVKLAAAFEVIRYVYLIGGVDELLNAPDSLTILAGDDVPTSFEKFRFGRDYFFGAMLRFNDEDLSALLAIGGSAVGGMASNR